MRRVMLLALLALALPMAALASIKDPIVIDFSVSPLGGSPSFIGATGNTSTGLNFGTGKFQVSVGPSDQSGLADGDVVNLTPNPFSYGAGTSGSIRLTKSWTDSLGSFSETFTSFMADRSVTNAITLTLSGTLSGPGGVTEPIVGILSANQAGGPGTGVGWSFTEHATGVTPIPEPGTLGLLGTGLIGLAGFAKRKLNIGA